VRKLRHIKAPVNKQIMMIIITIRIRRLIVAVRSFKNKSDSRYYIIFQHLRVLIIVFISLFHCFLLFPLWSLQHPWNAYFHFSFLILRQSVGLLGRGLSPSQDRYLHKHRINADRYSCFEWDSNPRSQLSSERRQFMPLTARPLWLTLFSCSSNKLETTLMH
jgi:hypothetical protein